MFLVTVIPSKEKAFRLKTKSVDSLSNKKIIEFDVFHIKILLTLSFLEFLFLKCKMQISQYS